MTTRLAVLMVLVTTAIGAGPSHAGKGNRQPPTIAERHAAYEAKTASLGARPTRRQAFVDGLRLRAAHFLIHNGLSGPFERRSNQGGVDEQIDAIITAGELRVSRLGLPRDEVRDRVQSQIDSFRAHARDAGKLHYDVQVPDNTLGVR